MKRYLTYVLVGAVILTGALGLWYFGPYEERNNRLLLSGTVEVNELDLSFRKSEKLQAVYVQEGDSIHRGQRLAKLDRDQFKNELKEARAKFRRTQADLAYAQKRFERQKRLYRKDLTSEKSLDRAKRNFQRSLEAKNQAREALDQAELNLKRTRLDSPIKGYVLSDNLDTGEFAAAGVPVVTIADLRDVWVRTYVNEMDLGRVKRGMPVMIRTDSFPDRRFKGRISFIADEAEFTPRTVRTREQRVKLMYRIKIDVDNPERKLKPGMPVDVLIRMTNHDN